MPLLGNAALAMWWDMAPEWKAEFEDWHSHEHFPERLAIPGFLRASRWSSADGGDGFFVIYELKEFDTLSSAAYLARLNAPTAWSTRMMPHHKNMVRSQCRVLESVGAGVARNMLTIRLSPAPGLDATLRASLSRLFRSIVSTPGLVGAHLLQTQTPALALTAEQKIRGGMDAAADWIVLLCGYDRSALEKILAKELNPESLANCGAQPAQISGLYGLSHAMLPADIQ